MKNVLETALRANTSFAPPPSPPNKVTAIAPSHPQRFFMRIFRRLVKIDKY